MKPKSLVWIVIGIVLVWLFVPVALKLRKLDERKTDLESEVRRLSSRNQTLERELELLKTDPIYIEHVARKTFNKAKEGEVVYKLVPPEQAASAAQASNGGN